MSLAWNLRQTSETSFACMHVDGYNYGLVMMIDVLENGLNPLTLCMDASFQGGWSKNFETAGCVTVSLHAFH